jgi:tetratricopeptide (TPR) repeat protein
VLRVEQKVQSFRSPVRVARAIHRAVGLKSELMSMTLRQILDLAVQHHQAGRFAEAEVGYRVVLKHQPNLADALHLLGLALHQTNRNEPALVEIRKAIALRPQTAEFYSSLAAVHLALEQTDPAIAAGQRAVELKPELPEAWLNLGNALATGKKYDQALPIYDRAIQLRPAFPPALIGLGNASLELKRYDEAEQVYRQAIALQPGFVDAHYNLGTALVQMEKFEAALECFQQAIALKPDHFGAVNNFACTLLRVGHLEDALQYLRQAIARYPNVARLRSNLGNALSEVNRLTEAIDCYRQALQIQPDFHEARFNLAIALLALGDFENGWREYESRWLCDTFPSPLRFAHKPLWRGEPLNGQRILIHFEQGFGDTIQFTRFVQMVSDCGGRVILQVQAKLLRLLSQTPGAMEVTCDPISDDRYDLQCPLWSLPLMLGITPATIPPPAPGMVIDPEQRKHWRERLASSLTDGHLLNVGVVWSGSPNYAHDYRRSVKLEYLAPLSSVPGLNLISLQKRAGAEKWSTGSAQVSLLDWTDELDDFADTAALIAELDLVIAVDTGVGHLAASLGKPTWSLLMFAPDFRWERDREDSPWYPSVKLFRQPTSGDWATPIARMLEELRTPRRS